MQLTTIWPWTKHPMKIFCVRHWVAHKEMLFAHCIVHLEHVTAKKLIGKCDEECSETVNETRSRPLDSRLLKTLCESIHLQHDHLLHKEVRWLSRRRILSRLIEIKEETKQFLWERNPPWVEFILHEMWMSKLAYLVDMFCHFKKLITSLQGFCTYIFVLRNKTDAFKKKLALRDSFVQKGDTEMFTTLTIFEKC